VPGDAVPWPEREVSSLPSLFPRLPPQAEQERYLSSYPFFKMEEHRSRELDSPLVTLRAAIVAIFPHQVYTELIWHILTHEEGHPGKSVGTFVVTSPPDRVPCLGDRD
jgi:hypothetical protein